MPHPKHLLKEMDPKTVANVAIVFNQQKCQKAELAALEEQRHARFAAAAEEDQRPHVGHLAAAV